VCGKIIENWNSAWVPDIGSLPVQLRNPNDRASSRPTSASQAKSLYPAALSAAVFDEAIALAIRGNRLEFHRLGADHAGNERYERALVIIHSASNNLRNRSFLAKARSVLMARRELAPSPLLVRMSPLPPV
jgi:hypothetical protein